MRRAVAALALQIILAGPLAAQASDPGNLPRRTLSSELRLLPSERVPGEPWREEQQQALTDPWFGPDKVRHFFTAAAAQALGYAALRSVDVEHDGSLIGASILTAVLGVGKELSDRRKGYGFSVRDLVWDAAGAAAISVMLVRTER